MDVVWYLLAWLPVEDCLRREICQSIPGLSLANFLNIFTNQWHGEAATCAKFDFICKYLLCKKTTLQHLSLLFSSFFRLKYIHRVEGYLLVPVLSMKHIFYYLIFVELVPEKLVQKVCLFISHISSKSLQTFWDKIMSKLTNHNIVNFNFFG